MAACMNCEHRVADHGPFGCGYSLGCDCPYDFDGEEKLIGVARCPARYAAGGSIDIQCAEPNGHDGDHSGRAAGEGLMSRWPNHTQKAARDEQVGGNHYRQFKIQPWDIWLEYGLDPWLAGVIKYLLRAGRKGPKLEDLKKARHYLDRAIEIEEGKQ